MERTVTRKTTSSSWSSSSPEKMSGEGEGGRCYRPHTTTERNIPLQRSSMKQADLQDCHLAFLKLFATNVMVWPLGRLLVILECGRKISYFGLFDKIIAKLIANFLGLYFSFCSFLSSLSFWKCFWPNLAWPGNPELQKRHNVGQTFLRTFLRRRWWRCGGARHFERTPQLRTNFCVQSCCCKVVDVVVTSSMSEWTELTDGCTSEFNGKKLDWTILFRIDFYGPIFQRLSTCGMRATADVTREIVRW